MVGRSRKSDIRIGHTAPMPYISSQHFRVYHTIRWPAAGADAAARDLAALKAAGVTHVVNCAAAACGKRSASLAQLRAVCASHGLVAKGETTDDIIRQLEGATELGKVLMLEEKPPPKPSVDAHAKLTIAPYKKSIVVTGTQFGDTQIKDALKSIKGSWNKSLSGWVFQGTRKDEVVAFLRQDATNTVTVVDTPYEPPAKKQKTNNAALGMFAAVVEEEEKPKAPKAKAKPKAKAG